MTDQSAHPLGVNRVIIAAVLATTAASMPVYLMGGLAVQAAADTGIDLAQLGGLTAAYFLSSSLWSIPAGRIVGRLGMFRSVLLAAGLSIVALVGIATLGRSVIALTSFMMVSGASNGIAQPAVNLMIARMVPVSRRGVAFGLKQAAVPLGSVLGGLAVPTIGLTIGWRWAFVIAAVTPVIAVLGMPRTAREKEGSTVPPGPQRHGPVRAGLPAISAGAGLANASTMALGTFYVTAAVSGGIAPAAAGLLLSLGSVLGIATRIVLGVQADRRGTGHIARVRSTLMLAASGFLLLAAGGPSWFVLIATGVVFAASWGWHGLLVHAVVATYPTDPATATALTQAGSYAGGVFGPVVIGVVSALAGFPVGWALAGSLTALGALMVRSGERRAALQGTRAVDG